MIKKIAKIMLARKDAFFAAAIYNESNGKVEGTNNKIMLLKLRAYGYRNMARFKLRIRLETSCLF
ncbi:transposase [Domibacillus iocasae]|uniref:transposase n=1 Tax=Domibacillus iocasae TaxID=1714016 RepID=UPI00114D2E9C|nr:transposase [Domibacillus iocasae]